MGVFSEKTSPRLTRIRALQWLEKRSNFEQLPADQDYKTAFTLTRMRALLRAIGNPERNFPSAHLAGTKGKGSTAPSSGWPRHLAEALRRCPMSL